MNLKGFLFVLVVFSVLTQLSLVQAQSISEITVNISGSGRVSVTEDFTVLSNETVVDLLLPRYNNLEVSSSGVSVPYANKTVNGGVRVELDLRDLPPAINMRDVSMSYGSQYMTVKNGSTWSISFMADVTPRKTIIKLYFPKNSTILSLSPRDVFFSVDRDSLWIYPQEDEFNFNCSYSYSDGAETVVVDVDGDGTLLLALAVLILLIVVVVVLYFLKKRTVSKVVGRLEVDKKVVSGGEPVGETDEIKKTRDIEFEFKTEKTVRKVKPTVFNVLNSEEKGIISFIQEHGPDDITQAFIYKTTRMPKSSLSEIVKRLEKRNVLECRREGRVNWIRLKKWILE